MVHEVSLGLRLVWKASPPAMMLSASSPSPQSTRTAFDSQRSSVFLAFQTKRKVGERWAELAISRV